MQRRGCNGLYAQTGRRGGKASFDKANGHPTKPLKEIQPSVVAAAAAYEPKEPPLVKGEGAIAFGGGYVLSDAGMDYLREVDGARPRLAVVLE